MVPLCVGAIRSERAPEVGLPAISAATFACLQEADIHSTDEQIEWNEASKNDLVERSRPKSRATSRRPTRMSSKRSPVPATASRPTRRHPGLSAGSSISRSSSGVLAPPFDTLLGPELRQAVAVRLQEQLRDAVDAARRRPLIQDVERPLPHRPVVSHTAELVAYDCRLCGIVSPILSPSERLMVC